MLPLWRERYLLLAAVGRRARRSATVGWAEAATLPLCLLTPDMQHRRIVDSAFAGAGATPEPVVETNSVATLLAHARSGQPRRDRADVARRKALPPDLRAIPLVDPR